MEKMDKIISLCKRRGFIFQSSEAYEGFASCYDYGPLGVELKNNIKQAWWRSIVKDRDEVYGLDAAILMHPDVWEASGHRKGFADLLAECKSCHKRFKLNDLEDQKECPECRGILTEAKQFNLMFKTFVGPIESDSSTTYLRPETAQGIFVNFNNIVQTSRAKMPFGIAQIGKAFRNEITPGNFIFRTREFEQMELEYFVMPQEAKKWYIYWQKQRHQWYIDFGIDKKHVRLREHKRDELAHYARSCSDVEYKFPFGWAELEGIANRGDFDLIQHSKFSKKDLIYRDEKTGKIFTPYIIEPSAGADRSLLAFLTDAYKEVKGGRTTTTESVKDSEVVLQLHKDLAPVKVIILPLVKKQPLINMAKDIYKELKKYWNCQYDEVGSIGRRYRRGDEIGVLWAVTVDFDSLEDKKATIRDRDTMGQDRIPIVQLADYLKEKLM